MKKLNFLQFLSEQQEAVITKSKSINTERKIVAIKWWISALMMLFALQLLNAQTTTSTCGELFFDDGGASRNYKEDNSGISTTDVFHICPDDPTNQVTQIQFNQCDIADGDLMLAYDGLTTEPDLLISSANGTDGSGVGGSVADAPGGGITRASCENVSGCITVAFTRDNNGKTAAGWTFEATCVARQSYSFPFAGQSLQITSADDNCVDLVPVVIDVPFYSDCNGGELIVTADCDDAFFTSNDNPNQLVANVRLGTTTVTFTSPLFPDQQFDLVIRTLPLPLTCNLALEVSLSGDCIIPLTPDMLLEDPCFGADYDYTIAFLDPNRDDFSDMAVVGMTSEGYPLVDFTGVPCGTIVDVVVQKTVSLNCGQDELFSECIAKMTLVDRVDPVISKVLDDYLIPCYYETGDLLDYLNSAGNGSNTTISLAPIGVGDLTNQYNYDLVVNSVESVFAIEDNCAAKFMIGDWEVVEFDCSTDEFDLYGTFDHDNDPNTPEIPVAQDPLWALMDIEVEDPNGTGGTPALFRCYYRRIKAIDDCGNTSDLALQRVCVAQPDVTFPLVDIEIPCGVDPDPINLYNIWLSDPVANEEYATFIPVYDPTPLDLNGNFSFFGNLDDTYFTDDSGDEVPVFPDGGACGYAIDWLDSRPVEVCAEAYQIFREWTVFNFCDGHLEIIDLVPQVITVGDSRPPEVEFIGIVGTGSPYDDCVSDAFIQVDIIDDCSDEFQAFVDIFGDGLPEQLFPVVDGGILVEDVPIGDEIQFTIRVVDECFNSQVSGPFVTILNDDIPPVAICESFRTVSMGVDCEVIVPAEVFDDGSYDNCGQISFSVARMDDIGDLLFDEDFDFLVEGDLDVFGPTITFTRDDLIDCTGTVEVVFRVEDGSGNSNFCMVEVELQDKLPPRIADVDIILDCDDHAAAQLIGAALSENPDTALAAIFNSVDGFVSAEGLSYLRVLNDNCDNSVFIVDFVDTDNFDRTCKQGDLRIFYQAIDACGNVSSPQIATVTLTNRSDWTMQFPMDIEVFCEDELTIPAATSIDDILTNDGCDFWALEVDEKEFTGPGGSCSKIIREYHFINWCTWHPSNTEIAVVERPEELILDPYYTVALRYQDRLVNSTDIVAADGTNDLDDGNEDGDPFYLYQSEDDRYDRFAPISIPFSGSQLRRIADADEATTYDPYDVTDYEFDADFVVIDFADFPYQNISTFPGRSQFTNVEQHYVSAQQYGNILYRQILKVNDLTPPNIDVTQSGPFCGGYDDPGVDGICSGEVELKFTVTDLCSPNTDIVYELVAFVGTPQEITLTEDPFGTLFKDREDYKLEGDYPIGFHQLVIKAGDNCGNIGKAFLDFEVKDCKAPTLVCHYGLSSDVMVNGEVTIEATEFESNVIEFCSDVELFFADPNIYPDSISRTFRCIDGEVGIVEVEIYARDEAGNTSFCNTFIRIDQNPQNGDQVDNCPIAAGSSAASVAGVIQTTNTETVQNVDVQLSGSEELMYETDGSGSFYFGGLEMGFDYSLTPKKDDDLLNGVTTLDLILISKHIIGYDVITDPYTLIAADVNNSGSITTFDIVSLRKAILGHSNEFTNNTSWRFVDANYEFIDPAHPFDEDFPEIINLNDLENDQMAANFVAIKIGDLNRSAQANNASAIEGRSQKTPFALQAQEQLLEAGQTYRIPITADVELVEGYQFTLALNDAQVMEVESAEVKEGNYALFEDALTVSWHQETTADDDLAFTLVLRAERDVLLSECLKLTDDRTMSIAYDWKRTPLEMRLDIVSESIQLAQNQPNPFGESTTISIYMPKAQEGVLSIQDLTGRIVYRQEQLWDAGQQVIELQAANLPNGILYYTFETSDFSATRKMIVLQ
ncbi:MAG: T9SS type A sorting domain-containing protein [Bacteroidota bacterium]